MSNRKRQTDELAALRLKRRWTAADGRVALAALSASGRAVTEFAALNGLDPWRLYHWRTRLGRGVGPAQSSVGVAASGPAFVPVRLAAEPEFRAQVRPVVPAMLELELSGQRRLRVPEGFPPEAVARLVFALEGGAPC